MKGKYEKYFDKNFFEIIDSEIKAYLLGFIYADGSIEQDFKNRIYRVCININKKDVKILNLYRQYIDPYSSIKYKTTKREKTGYISETIQLRFCSKKMINDLIKLGCVPRKTYKNVNLPNISKNLIPHFIRGYFDGDGCAYILKTRNSYTIRVNFKSEYQTLKDISEFLSEKQIYSYLEDQKQNCYKLYINRKEDIKSFYYLIYNDANYFFERKRNIMKKIMLTPREIREFALQIKKL